MKKLLLLFLLLPFLGFAQVSGTYIISTSNSDANFKTLTAAVARINAVGLSGPVTFLLDENQTINSQIVINQLKGSSAINTLTIKPNVEKDVVINANMADGSTGVAAVFMFNGADNIIIDGYNSETSSRPNLTLLNNDNLNYTFRSIIWIASNGSIGSSNIIVKNSILKFSSRNQQNSLLAAIYSGSNSIGGNNTINVSSSTASNSNITVENNEFLNVKEGVHIEGNGDVLKRSKNWNIHNNTMKGGEGSANKLNRGIYVLNSTNFVISNNFISGVLRYSNATFQETAGISIVGESSGKVDSNIIDDVSNLNYASDGAIGGVFINVNKGLTITVSNNMISKVYSGAKDSNDWNYYYKGFGIYVKSGGIINLYFNTIVMNYANAGGLTSCVYLESGAEFNIKNNIFYNSQPGTQYGIFGFIPISNIKSISNNDYFIANSTGNFSNRLKNTTYTGATGFTSWKEDLDKEELGSIIQLPIFDPSNGLHLKSGSANDNLQGVSISGISTDIDGEFRVKPYMGADEIVCVLPTVSAGGSFKICTGSTTPPMGGSVTGGLSAQWTGGTGTWTNADDPARATYTAGPGESGLVTLTLTSTGSCGSVSSTATVTIGAISTYNGTEWTNGNPNTENNGLSIIIASGTYKTSHDNNIIACSCEVKSGASLVISSGTFAKIDNNLTIRDGGNITVESDGNLIQIQDTPTTPNSGIITVKRDIKVSGNRQQYNYLGSPVAFTADQSYKTIYPGTTFVLYHNEANNLFYNSSGANVPGRGLAVKEPTGKGEETVTAVYKGLPQNGVIEFGMINGNVSNPNRGYNLLGNPYPSNIDLKKLYKINGGDERKNIDANFYFWDNTANEIFDQKGDNYEGEAYAIFNVLAGSNGTGTKAATVGKGHVPTNYVKVGQGFMGRSLKASYKLIYNNSIRVDSEPPVDFFGKNSTASQDDRYWLQMKASSGIVSTMAIVHYAEGNDLFGLEDSRTMGGSDGIYSIIDNEKLAIDGRSSFQNAAVIPLGTQHFINGNYTIGIEGSEGIFANGQPIYLKDKQTGTVTNVTEGDYAFAANAGSSTGRFEIIYRPETVLVTDTKVKEGIVVYRDGNDFVIKGPKTIASIEVYDPSGKLVTILQPNSKQGVLDSSKLIRGMYLLKITSADGEVTSKKIIK